METTSQTSRGTNYSVRAHNLLREIKIQTSTLTNARFLETLSLFKNRTITSEEVQARVSEILADHPVLLAKFFKSVPQQPSSPVKTESHFSTALDFVNKVKQQHEPAVYEEFLNVLRDFQSSGKTEEVIRKVNSLLKSTPYLVEEFRAFSAKQEMIRGDSDATLPERLIETEATPLLPQNIDVESQVERKSVKNYVIGGFSALLLGTAGAGYYLWSAGYLPWI